jgi:hypothetical protein
MAVYWPIDQEWYGGRLLAVAAAQRSVKVRYDDGDEEVLGIDSHHMACEVAVEVANLVVSRESTQAPLDMMHPVPHVQDLPSCGETDDDGASFGDSLDGQCLRRCPPPVSGSTSALAVTTTRLYLRLKLSKAASDDSVDASVPVDSPRTKSAAALRQSAATDDVVHWVQCENCKAPIARAPGTLSTATRDCSGRR